MDWPWHQSRLARLEKELAELVRLQRRTLQTFVMILEELMVTTAHSAKLSLEGEFMPLKLSVGETFSAKLHEFTGAGGTGTELPPVGAVSFSSSDTAVATVDPSTGKGAAVAPGTASISGSDAGNGLTSSESVTVVAPPPPVATSAVLELSTP